MAFLSILVTLLLVIIISYLKSRRSNKLFVKELPGPPTLPLLGNAMMLLGKSLPQILQTLETLPKIYGKTVRFYIGPTHQMLLMTDPKDIQVVLRSQKLIEKSDEYKYTIPWVSTGLLTSSGQKYFSRRKAITPAFHFKILEQFVDVFDKHSKIFVKNLAKFKGQRFDVFPQVTSCALDIICGKMRKIKANN